LHTDYDANLRGTGIVYVERHRTHADYTDYMSHKLSDNNGKVIQMTPYIWRTIKRPEIPAVKVEISLIKDDNKLSDWTVLLP